VRGMEGQLEHAPLLKLARRQLSHHLYPKPALTRPSTAPSFCSLLPETRAPKAAWKATGGMGLEFFSSSLFQSSNSSTLDYHQ
jgi:hypothetical protein